MKKDEVKVGGFYTAKVSGRMATVRIDAENPRGGWDATNLTTTKKVRIKSAQRLRHETRGPGQRAKPDLPDRQAGVATTVEAVEKGDLTKGVKVPTARKKRGEITEATKADAVDAAMQAVAADKKKRQPKPKADKPAKQRKPSGLDAAAQVLAEAGEPLGCKEMVDRMLAKGYWQTQGKTPAATIYAAIIREIATKGDDSRFRKVDRGKFALAN